jgi:hypothetical protein
MADTKPAIKVLPCGMDEHASVNLAEKYIYPRSRILINRGIVCVVISSLIWFSYSSNNE